MKWLRYSSLNLEYFLFLIFPHIIPVRAFLCTKKQLGSVSYTQIPTQGFVMSVSLL